MPKKKRRKAPRLVAPLGPATNLRPAGVHESEKTYNRKKIKAALEREEDESGFDVSGFS
ncbi:MAG: hypothetical protein ACLQPV_06930 [Vulcanimicrobiaceae bacterium]